MGIFDSRIKEQSGERKAGKLFFFFRTNGEELVNTRPGSMPSLFHSPCTCRFAFGPRPLPFPPPGAISFSPDSISNKTFMFAVLFVCLLPWCSCTVGLGRHFTMLPRFFRHLFFLFQFLFLFLFLLLS